MGPCCRINEQNQSEGYYPAGVTSTAPLTRGVTRWYVYDGLGSVVAELDDNNNMTTSGQCDVYGAPRAGTQQGVAGTSGQGYVGSLGHVTDQSTGGLIYMQARYYDPGVGRFVSEDTEPASADWFTYCDDNPVCAKDPDGHNPVSPLEMDFSVLCFGLGFSCWFSAMFCVGAGKFKLALAFNAMALTLFTIAAEGFSEPPSQKIISEAVDATEAAVSLVAMLTMNEQAAEGFGITAALVGMTALYSLEILGAAESVGADVSASD
jgi:RHS repeat-associated protein